MPSYTSREIAALVLRASEDDEVARAELEREGVLRASRKRLSGDYGEYLIAQHYRGELARRKNNKGCDIFLPDGDRIEVKSRHVEGRRPQWFGKMDSLMDRPFETLVALLFDPDYGGAQAWAMDWGTACRHAKKYANTPWRLPFKGPWRDDPAVERFRLSA